MRRYYYETHLHTLQSSKCGKVDAAEMVRLYKDAGYTGVVITDHFIGGNTAIDRSLPWEEWVNQFCRSYEIAKAEGDEIGLQVFFGWESGFKGTEFLIYGLDKQWLLDHPQIRDCTVQEQYELVSADGGLVIHAHPYRIRSYHRDIHLYPDCIDAVEAVNGAHSSSVIEATPQDLRANRLAEIYSKEYCFPVTSGSDQHGSNLYYGGMAFSRKMEDIHDLIRAIRVGEAVALLNGPETM